jgi:hypothetical protein
VISSLQMKSNIRCILKHWVDYIHLLFMHLRRITPLLVFLYALAEVRLGVFMASSALILHNSTSRAADVF